MAYRDPEVGRERHRDRLRRNTAGRIAQGLCPRCGKAPPAPDRSLCEPCAEKQNRATRARHARLRAAGKPRQDPERAQAYERERYRRLSAAHAAHGLCKHCGKAPAAEGRTACEPCAEKRRAADRASYAARKAASMPHGNAEKVTSHPQLSQDS